MARASTVIDIFLSSPSDCLNEHEIVKTAVREWNDARSKHADCLLSLISFENVSPNIGVDAQDVVNQEVGDEYDVFLCLLWTRLGTPTSKFPSGTVEEYQRALSRYKDKQDLRIAVFVKNALPDRLDQIDASQLQGVRDLKEALKSDNILYKDFITKDQLKTGLSQFFEHIANSKEKFALLTKSPARVAQVTTSEIFSSIQVDDDNDNDDGLIEAHEELERSAAKMTKFFAAFTRRQSEINSMFERVAGEIADITKLGSFSLADAAGPIESAARGIADFADYVDDSMIELRANNVSLLSSFRSYLNIGEQFSAIAAQKGENIQAIAELRNALVIGVPHVDVFLSTLSTLPRLAKRLTKSRNRLVRSLEQFRFEMVKFISELSELVEEAGQISLGT